MFCSEQTIQGDLRVGKTIFSNTYEVLLKILRNLT